MTRAKLQRKYVANTYARVKRLPLSGRWSYEIMRNRFIVATGTAGTATEAWRLATEFVSAARAASRAVNLRNLTGWWISAA